MVPLLAFAVLICGIVLAVAILVGRGRRHWSRHLIAEVALVVASFPLGAIVALALLPLWRWLEASYAIESVGHSGPADWCYLVSTVACLLALSAIYVTAGARGGDPRGREREGGRP